MEAFLATVIMLLFLPAAGIVIFFLTIHPVWAIIDVAISRDKTTGEKTVWIILMFIIWSLGSLIYGFIFATRPLAITTRVLFIALFILIVMLVTMAIVAPMTVDRLRGSIGTRRLRVSDSRELMLPERIAGDQSPSCCLSW